MSTPQPEINRPNIPAAPWLYAQVAAGLHSTAWTIARHRVELGSDLPILWIVRDGVEAYFEQLKRGSK